VISVCLSCSNLEIQKERQETQKIHVTQEIQERQDTQERQEIHVRQERQETLSMKNGR